jgi:hypothetical protein
VPADRALRPFLTLDLLRMSRYRMFFSSAKAEAELGYARGHGRARSATRSHGSGRRA